MGGLLGLYMVGCQLEASPVTNSGSQFEFVARSEQVADLDVQGHRGARGLLPENTLPAVEAALDLGVTTLEVDLHLTQDGQVVVWHDPIIEREKCQLPQNGNGDVPDPKNPLRRVLISQQPLAIVQQYQCDLNPDNGRFPQQQALTMPLAGAHYHIVTLTELFAFVQSYADSGEKSAAQRKNAAVVQFNIELKRVPDHPEYINDGFTGGEVALFETAVLQAVAAAGVADRVIIQSFDHRPLRLIREIDPEIRLAALTTGGEDKVEVYAAYGFNIWSPNHRDITPANVQKAHEEGLLVIPWTVNEESRMRELISLGVDGLITDRPDLLLKLK